MRRRPTCVVVLGMMGRTPFAGVAWQVLHYLEGLRRLGHDVYYVEDTGDWPYDPERNAVTGDPAFTVRYIAGLMARIGFDRRWAYCSTADNSIYGLSAGTLSQVLKRTDVLINLTGATLLRAEHMRAPVRIYLETDPVLPSVEVAQGKHSTIEFLSAHTHHFSFGENLGTAASPLPVGPFTYRPTRQPIVIDWWTDKSPPSSNSPRPGHFTTIANWRQAEKDIEWNGETYFWSKHLEFLKFLDLPARSRQSIELALACDDVEALALLSSHGWRVCDALLISRDVDSYRRYIIESHAEFTVAKDQNIRLRSGWFSDRSACYLAAGRPVITQDTGFGGAIPTGEGLFSFLTMDGILQAIDTINADYARQSRAARAIAEEYFRAETVLSRMLDQVGV